MSPSETIAYADCFSGISGDMFLGAILHCGLPEETLRGELAKLNLEGFDLNISSENHCGIGSCKVDVIGEPQSQFRHLSSIRKIIEESDLDEHIRRKSLDIFAALAKAEAKVHDIDIEKVHFHEVGAIDTIVDIVGTVAGLHHLGITRLYTSPLPSPRGMVSCAHGNMPLPAPAVCELLEDVPCYGVDVQKELVTPTGAALLKVLTSEFGQMPPMRIRRTGYGAGSAIREDNTPNLFRLIVGQTEDVTEHQLVEVIETHIDDWSPEGYQYLCEKLIGGGALDVSLAPIHMKKGRPGFNLTVIVPPQLSLEIRQIIFSETTAIGVRIRKEQRHTLPRRKVEVETPWGKLSAKMVTTPHGETLYPEYEECKQAARKHNIPLKEVYRAVIKEGKD